MQYYNLVDIKYFSVCNWVKSAYPIFFVYINDNQSVRFISTWKPNIFDFELLSPYQVILNNAIFQNNSSPHSRALFYLIK